MPLGQEITETPEKEKLKESAFTKRVHTRVDKDYCTRYHNTVPSKKAAAGGQQHLTPLH